MLTPLQRLGELQIGIGERCPRIHVAGCVKALGNIGQRHVLGEKFILLVMKVLAHGYYLVSGWLGIIVLGTV